ncbi:MAG: hypothetical protein ACFBSE_08495 [Prochloraceae cyanobacterium]
MLEPLSLSLLIAVLFLAVLLVISYLVFILPSKIEKTDSQAKDSTEIKELREKLSTQSQELNIDFRRETFDRLQNLLTNYPTVRKMAEVKPNLPAKNLTALFTSLDSLLANWNYEPIGQPWQEVEYNPQLHQPDSEEIKAGDRVYIRFIGYRHGETILYPAKVSLTLPAGVKSNE